jgi:hypothetical protein
MSHARQEMEDKVFLAFWTMTTRVEARRAVIVELVTGFPHDDENRRRLFLAGRSLAARHPSLSQHAARIWQRFASV